MLDNNNNNNNNIIIIIISTSVSEAVEKIPTDEKDYCKIANAPLGVLICTAIAYKEQTKQRIL